MKTKRLHQLKQKTNTVLDKPGVYRMLDTEGHLLYIGKSVHLRQRVASYWVNTEKRSTKIKRMISQVSDFQVYYTDTELDALLLECRWIQNQKPPYNTLLTKSGKYRYMTFYNNPYRLKLTRKYYANATLCIGPLPHKRMAQAAYRFIESYYPYLICTKTGIGKATCIPYQKQTCPAPCTYQKQDLIQQIRQDLMSGVALQQQLEKEMADYAEDWAYEKAAEVLYCLKGLKYLQHMYTLLCELEQENYIGRLAIQDTFLYKYYLVKEGRICNTYVGSKSEEEYLIKQWKKEIGPKEKQEKRALLNQEIDQILIIKAFKKKEMHIIQV